MPKFRPKKRGALTEGARTRIRARFRRAVNMSPAELERWLQTEDSKAVGFRPPGARTSVGRQSGRKIVRILRGGPKTEADYRHMQKVAGYVARHTAQRPAGNVRASRWRYSLKNWGHEPVR